MPELAHVNRFQRGLQRIERDYTSAALAEYRALRGELLDLMARLGPGSPTLAIAFTQRLQAFKARLQAIIQQFTNALSSVSRLMVNDSLDLISEFEELPPFGALEIETAQQRLAILASLSNHIADFVDTIDAQMRIALADIEANNEGEAEAVRRLLAARLTNDGASVYRLGATALETSGQRLIWQTGTALTGAYVTATRLRILKQAVATINNRTTDTCLRVHGQTQLIGTPFELTGRPRFSRQQQHPPFHWNCRTVERFISRRMNEDTGEFRDEARRERRRRE